MGKYTERQENAVFEFTAKFDYEEYDEHNLLDYLHHDFQPFNESLKAFISAIMPADCKQTPEEYFKVCQIKKGVTALKKSTCSNWFNSGKRPKKSVDSREKLFAVAFVLDLTVDETADLFHKVYLDRAFNARDCKEIIYYYCLKNNRTYADAQKLMEQVSIDNDNLADETIYTTAIQSNVDTFANDMELIQYINTHPHNFSINNKKAKEIWNTLMVQAKAYAQKEIEVNDWSDSFRNKNRHSDSLMYEVIIGQSITGKTGTKTIFKNMYFPQEIKTNFPERTTFSKSEPTYEELRKIIVLLKSYCFWSEAKTSSESDFYDDYIDEMNEYLNDSGFSELYPGNPFDWLFLFCTYADNPLDMFRSVLCEALEYPQS